MRYDFCIIGAGIVGLATAKAILDAEPGASVVVLEKEEGPAVHQTGHNSGVIHSGIYYPPGSLKARLCKQGEADVKAFCAEHDIPFETCGKLIVATDEREVGRLDALHLRAAENDIACERLDRTETMRREPRISALAALHVPSTGIVDYRLICEALCAEIVKRGGAVVFGTGVSSIKEDGQGVTLRARDSSWEARRLVACAGLQADRVARLAGLAIDYRIIPFRGEYFRLPEAKWGIVRHLIYPTPDPELPFLGIHITRMIDGSVTVGPNAVLGFAREGYRKFTFNPRDLLSVAGFPGTWRSVARFRKAAVAELRNSMSKRLYLAECRKYCPELEVGDLTASEAGIRAQVVRRDGSFAGDFLFEETDRMLHVLNAPSPAATSALPIGRMIAGHALGSLHI